MAQQGSTTVEEAFPPVIGDDQLHADRPSRRRNMTILAIGLVGWAAPIVAAALLLGPGSVVVEQGLFFSGTASSLSAARTRRSPTSRNRL